MVMVVPALKKIEVSSTSNRITAFRDRFGDGHFYLACHAALPMALTPDLLYAIWANFQDDVDAKSLEIPWVAVTDLLFSSLCSEVSRGEIHEMDPTICQELLKYVQFDTRLGDRRILELSKFVTAYAEPYLRSIDSDIDQEDLARTQQWRALTYSCPSEAAIHIAATFKQISQDDQLEWQRMERLLETMEEPLSDFPELLRYARLMAHSEKGNDVVAAKYVDNLPKIVRAKITQQWSNSITALGGIQSLQIPTLFSAGSAAIAGVYAMGLTSQQSLPTVPNIPLPLPSVETLTRPIPSPTASQPLNSPTPNPTATTSIPGPTPQSPSSPSPISQSPSNSTVQGNSSSSTPQSPSSPSPNLATQSGGLSSNAGVGAPITNNPDPAVTTTRSQDSPPSLPRPALESANPGAAASPIGSAASASVSTSSSALGTSVSVAISTENGISSTTSILQSGSAQLRLCSHTVTVKNIMGDGSVTFNGQPVTKGQELSSPGSITTSEGAQVEVYVNKNSNGVSSFNQLKSRTNDIENGNRNTNQTTGKARTTVIQNGNTTVTETTRVTAKSTNTMFFDSPPMHQLVTPRIIEPNLTLSICDILP